MSWSVCTLPPRVAPVLSFVAAGFSLGLSLIVAIGAQNLFVLRQGIRREHVLAVASVCALSDAVLIVAGVSGIGALLHAWPGLIEVVRCAGALFLLGYAGLAARRALRGGGDVLQVTPTSRPAGSEPARLMPVLLTCFALTWLNPHVYLDTVFLLGSVANTHGAAGRWWFAGGAAAASVAWFFSLALGTRYLGRWLSTSRAWRVLDGVIAVVMAAIAVSLVWPHD
ncbi:amino acid transporter [Microbacterium sp. VKM Ac-2870]|uniref:LysE/ArgO family amino acid transporter n=1 Tax=Microbacterium sp. VKM Ac-2870 TaxID=2783825 RepID=UPI00188C77D3|nr:amino acid transporter [Microbacterium sp. VKM Ac-2870]